MLLWDEARQCLVSLTTGSVLVQYQLTNDKKLVQTMKVRIQHFITLLSTLSLPRFTDFIDFSPR